MTQEPRHERRYASMRTADAFPGVVRRLLGAGAALSLVEIQIASGHELPEHVRPHEQAGQVASGRARFTIGEQTVELRHGDAYLIPGGVTHHMVALEPATLIETFSPVRHDFLE